MSNLLVDNKDIKISKSAFAIYKNEVTTYEGKTVPLPRFMYNLNKGIFRGLEIEILNTIYTLKFATSRQITQYLNVVKHIDEKQGSIMQKLTKLHNNNTVGRYSFASDERPVDTNLKAYKLENNGKRLLVARKYSCNWTAFETSNVEEIKSILARNQYILKLLEECVVEKEVGSKKVTESRIEGLSLDTKVLGVGASYVINNTTHLVIPLRKNDSTEENIINIFNAISKNGKYGSLPNKKYIMIGEDDTHLVTILIKLINSKQYSKYGKDIYFTQDLRILDRNIANSFVRVSIEKGANGKPYTKIDEIIQEDLK